MIFPIADDVRARVYTHMDRKSNNSYLIKILNIVLYIYLHYITIYYYQVYFIKHLLIFIIYIITLHIIKIWQL